MGEKPTSEDEIEITPEMTEAGVDVYRDELGDDWSPIPLEGEVLEKVFRAMLRAARPEDCR